MNSSTARSTGLQWTTLLLAALLVTCSWTPPAVSAGRTKILLDLPPRGGSPGECLTAAAAARSRRVDLVGLTTRIAKSSSETAGLHEVLEMAGRRDVGVGVAVSPAARGQTWHPVSERTDLPEVENATEVLLAAALKDTGALTILVSGGLDLLEQALDLDAELGTRLKHVFVRETQIGNSKVLDELAAAGTAVTVVAASLEESLLLTRPRLLSIATTASPLTDLVTTQLAGNLPGPYRRHYGPHVPYAVPLPELLPLLAAAHPEVCEYRDQDAETGAHRRVCIRIKPYAAFDQITNALSDETIDFSQRFAHFLLRLPMMAPESRATFRAALKDLPLNMEPEGDLPRRIAALTQMRSYISAMEQVLRDIGDEEGLTSAADLAVARTRLAGFGVLFPARYYEAQTWPATSEGLMPIRIRVLNPLGLPVTNLRAGLQLPEQTHSQTIGSSTETQIDFHFSNLTWETPPRLVPVTVQFEEDGKQYRFKYDLQVDLTPGLALDRVDWASTSVFVQGSSGVVLADSTVTLAVGEPEAQLYQATELSEPKVLFQFPAVPQQDRFGQISWTHTGDLGTMTETLQGLVPAAVQPLRVCSTGPHGLDPVFVPDWEGRSAWTTDYIYDVTGIEYALTPQKLVLSATGPIRVEFDYFANSDLPDTFRLEAATERGAYIPATSWLKKPAARGWHQNSVRLSPEIEILLRAGEIRWFLLKSSIDGDEVVHGLRIYSDN